MDDLKLIDTKALARLLDKSTSTIKRWRKEGKLPPPRIEFSKAYWTVEQIRVWVVQSGSIESTRGENI